MTIYATSGRNNGAISPENRGAWFNVTLPGGYIAGDGFDVEIVATPYSNNPAAVPSIGFDVGASSFVAGTWPTPNLSAVGPASAGPFDGNTPSISWAPGTTTLQFFSATGEQGVDTGPLGVPVTLTFGIPGSNYQFFNIADPDHPTRVAGCVLADASIAPGSGFPDGTGMPVGGYFGGNYSVSNPANTNIPLGFCTWVTDNGQFIGGIPEGSVSYHAGDTITVAISMFSTSTPSQGQVECLISSITTIINGARTSIPITDLQVGFHDGVSGALTPAGAISFSTGSVSNPNIFLADFANHVQGYIF